MAMLAGPRVKQKVINLRAKNNAWSNDKNKFGQKMLEKMGWSEGKGLGAKENGIVEHVVARYKNDDKGLGYVDRSDQWTKHEDDFNAILANLSNATNNEDLVPSGNSLEKKSKNSKARIHYHKFTRGKDLSRYSEKDLANIFGKKSLKNIESSDEKNGLNEQDNQKEKVFTDKGSMDEYFKKKLASLKIKRKLSNEHCDTMDQNIPDHCFQGFNPLNDGSEYECKGYDKSSNTDVSISVQGLTNTEEPKVKHKKKKKLKCSEQPQYVNEANEFPYLDETKISTTKTQSSNNTDIDKIYYATKCDLTEVKRKKKKKSKNKEKQLQDFSENIETVTKDSSKLENVTSLIAQDNVDEPVKKKRKKGKNKEEYVTDQSLENVVHKSKKKKKEK